jgi:hypothetical protein
MLNLKKILTQNCEGVMEIKANTYIDKCSKADREDFDKSFFQHPKLFAINFAINDDGAVSIEVIALAAAMVTTVTSFIVFLSAEMSGWSSNIPL